MTKHVTRKMNIKTRMAKAYHICKSTLENKNEAIIVQIMLENVRPLTNLQLN